ncbi:Gti1/Pac2 family-domain-containing protein [Hypomontagnella monticulosa]|nr:Gti1/Pac2 family-domain-containing protein [Hypomontagnella monticulosa]
MASGSGIMAVSDRPAGSPLQPTFHGYIASTMDALILFEACLTGHLFHVPRRPHDRERPHLIVSGNVFIYEEHSSGIKRWTDGVPWSPSRILGNFLLYRELDKPFQPGEKKRAMKRNKSEAGITKPVSTSTSRPSSNGSYSTAALMTAVGNPATGIDNANANRNDTERALVGSLIDSYQFKQDGLVKKTISVTYQGIQHHMVSYYKLDDVMHSKLETPSQNPALSQITPRGPLISSGSFRAPVDDHEVSGAASHFRGLVDLNHSYGGYGMNGVGSRSMSMPSMQSYGPTPWAGHSQYVPSYSMSQALPPPSTYAPAPPYSYSHGNMVSYDMTPRSSVSSISSLAYQQQPLPVRRQSMMNNGTGIGPMDFPSGLPEIDHKPSMSHSSLMSNGTNGVHHGLPGQSTYTNGTAYQSSTSNGTANFDGRTAQQASVDFSTSLPEQQVHNPVRSQVQSLVHDQVADPVADHTHEQIQSHQIQNHQVHNHQMQNQVQNQVHGLVSANQDTTPQEMQLSLEDSESASGQMAEPDWPTNGFGDDNFPQ